MSLEILNYESGQDNNNKNSSPVMENEVNNSEELSPGSYPEPVK